MINDLERKSHSLMKAIFSIPNSYDSDEMKMLVANMRNTAVAIPTNIEQGKLKKKDKKAQQYYMVAKAYLKKLNADVEKTKELGIINAVQYKKMESEIKSINEILNEFILPRKSGK